MVNPPKDDPIPEKHLRELADYELRVQAARAPAIEALTWVAKAIRSNSGTGQRRRLTQFLGGLFNGHHYPFDLSELRGLDRKLREACLTMLAYDSMGHQDVHKWGPVGAEELVSWLKEDGHYYAAQKREKARELYRHRYGENGHDPQQDD